MKKRGFPEREIFLTKYGEDGPEETDKNFDRSKPYASLVYHEHKHSRGLKKETSDEGETTFVVEAGTRRVETTEMVWCKKQGEWNVYHEGETVPSEIRLFLPDAYETPSPKQPTHIFCINAEAVEAELERRARGAPWSAPGFGADEAQLDLDLGEDDDALYGSIRADYYMPAGRPPTTLYTVYVGFHDSAKLARGREQKKSKSSQ